MNGRRLRRVGRRALASAVALSIVSASLPPGLIPTWIPSAAPQIADAETLASPRYVSAALLPNGHVGLLFTNVDGSNTEIRFAAYSDEHLLKASVQLSTAGPYYPQLAVLGSTLVAAYVDTRSPNVGKLILRTSTNNGVSWSSESNPFGSETFEGSNLAPRLVASRNGQTLYLFKAVGGQIPTYRSTTDLSSWTTAANAGDSSMRVVNGNNCGSAGAECYRAHAFGFMETATSGQWVYISKSDSGWGQSGRGTQTGSLGGSWSTQVDHGGSGGLSGGGDSTATTFLGRDNAVYFVRAGGYGEKLYYKKSTDAGASWGAVSEAYVPGGVANYTTAAPVGLYIPGYTFGEYVWYAGWSGSEDTVRVIPLWAGPQAYADSGTVRLLGSAGGDFDAGSMYPYNFASPPRSIGAGSYVTAATDLALPGRLLPLSFTRTYNSADGFDSGPLGRAWTHSYHWWLTDSGSVVTIRRGSGRQDRFTLNPDTSYTSPPGVSDTLVKSGATYTLTTRDQVSYDFAGGRLSKIREPAGNQITLGYTSWNLVRIPVGGTVSYSASRCCATGYEPDKAANGVINSGWAAGIGWQVGAYTVGDWWKATWSTAQALTRVRLWDFYAGNDYYGQGHLEFSDSSTVNFGPLPNDAGAGGEDFREVSFARKTGITWMKVVTDSNGSGWPGLAEVEAYDDETAPQHFNARLNVITDTVGRRVTLGYAAEANLALGRSYTTSVSPHTSWPDTGSAELTDGMRGDSSLYNDRSYQAHQNLSSPLEVTVDLGSAQAIGVVRSDYFHYPNDGVYKPSSVEVLTSTDNVSYTSRGSSSGALNVNWRWNFDVTANAAARYVRLKITSGGQWLFSSEIRVGPQGALLPGGLVPDRLVSLSDGLGRRTTYRYDSSGRLASVVDKLGNSSGADPEQHKWTYGYEGGTSHLATITDPDGRTVVTNSYDSLGRLATQKDGLLNTTTFGYPAGQLTVTDPRSHVTTQSFDARNRIISQQDTLGANTYTLSYTYDDCGNRSSTTDRNGNRTDYTFDTACKGNLLELEEPQLDGQTPRFTTTFAYDTRNNPTQVTDAKGFVTTHTYHATSNVRLSTTSEIDATTTATTKYEYGDSANPGLVTKIIAPRGNTTGTPNYTFSTSLSYDSSGNLIERIDADGAKTTHTYDTAGRRLTTVDPDGYASGQQAADHTWTTAYDANDQVLTETNPLSQTATTTYYGAGQFKAVTDRRGNVTTYIYDSAGRLWKVQQRPDPSGQPTLVYETVVGRDASGNVTSVTQANGAVTDYTYDALNRLTTTTVHPSTGVNRATTLVLDGNGNALSRTTADSVVTTYTYDNLSRLKTVSASGLSTITYGYDELSRRTSMQDGTGTTTYGYDRLDRLASAAQPNGTTTYGYDRDSNRTSVSYPGTGGGTVNYVYSNGGRLSSLTDWSSRTATYTYHASGLADTVSVPGGMTIDYGYDRAQRLTSLTNMVGTTPITTHSYTLDAEGNRTQLVEFLTGVTSSGQTETFGYTYDGLNRLGAVTTTNAETFTLDGASNITARTGPSATYTIDGENRPTSDGTNTFTWSNADRLTGRGSDTFGYDALDRLTSSTVASTSRTYAYSGDGLLQSRTQGSTTSFLWDPATSPSRLLAQGGDRIVYGLGPLYIIKADGTTRALARDGGKSVRAEVNGSGAVTGSWRYRAYGEINQTSGQTTPSILGYAGQLLDPSGLYYMRARWYDALTGRFITRDPLGGSAANPSSLNAFGYATANPANVFDPTGLEGEPMLDPGSGGCGGACESEAREGTLLCGGVLWCHVDTNSKVLTAPAPRTTVCVLTLAGCSVLFFENTSNEAVDSGDRGGPSIGPAGDKRVEQLRAIWENRRLFLNWLRGTRSLSRQNRPLSIDETRVILENADRLGIPVDTNAAGQLGQERTGKWARIPHVKVGNVHIPIDWR